MIPPRISSIPLIIALISLLSGCRQSNQPLTPPISPVVTNEATQGVISFISTSTISPTSTFTPVPTGTFTLVPTLSSDEAHARLHALLNSAASCNLPCWLGVTPGQTTWQEANEQLTAFGSIADGLYIKSGADKWSTESLTIPYLGDQMVVEVSISYPTSSTERKVTVISADSRAYKIENGQYIDDVYGYAVYNELLKQYFISEILSRYGPPDNIFITANLRGDTLITPGFGDYFELHIWYPNQGIFMMYKMAVERFGNNYTFCPSNAFVFGDFIPPDHGSDYQALLPDFMNKYQYFFPPAPYVKTPQEALGMTNQEFYELFRTPTDRCLETPISTWRPK